MSWTHDTVLATVRDAVAQYAESPGDMSEQTELVADLGIDSLGVMEAVADIEDRFELTISDDELREVATLGDVVRAIEDRLRADGRLQAEEGS